MNSISMGNTRCLSLEFKIRHLIVTLQYLHASRDPELLLQRPVSIETSLEQRERVQKVIAEIRNYLVSEMTCEWNGLVEGLGMW